MIVRYIMVLLISLLMAQPVQSAPRLDMSGDFIPGALIMGQTDPGNMVSVDGNPVRVSSDGHFLIGLGRDAEGSTAIRINAEQTLDFDIANRDYKIQRIEGLPTNQVTPDPTTQARIKRERPLITNVRKIDNPQTWFTGGFMWPVIGPISGVYGSQRILNGKPRSPHNGVDIAAPKGSTIVAMGDGVVALVHDDMFYTGKTVMIDHGHGLTSVYIHMDSLLVSQGQIITKGTPIGTVGQTGRVTGPHLHWGVTLFSTHLDPMLVVGPMPQ